MTTRVIIAATDGTDSSLTAVEWAAADCPVLITHPHAEAEAPR